MSQDSRRALLQACGLTVVEGPVPESLPGVLDAWQPVISISAEPAARVSLKSPVMAAEVDRTWYECAERNAVFSSDGSFLISVAGPGAIELGWAIARYSEGARLASRLTSGESSPEFIAMSVDGKRVCGVTPEERDVWIVCAFLEE